MVEEERAIVILIKAINSAEKFRTLESRQSSEAAVFYYEKAVEALKTVGTVAVEFAAEFVTPGGVENLRKHAQGEISDVEYVFNIANDQARDAVIAAIGAHLGGSAGGFAGAVIGGGVGALPTAAATATAGAFAGYVYSRAATAAGRTFARTSSEFRGNAAARVQKCRVQRTFGQGKFWENDLISSDSSKQLHGLSAKRQNAIKGDILQAKRKLGGEIKADIDGFLYKFDPAHKTGKAHLHKYTRDCKLIAEVDPETGAVICLK